MGLIDRNDVAVTGLVAARTRPLASRRDGRLGYALWGLAGFLLGALFWHFVGFWEFVANVVHRRDNPPTVLERLITSQFAGDASAYIEELAERESEAHRAAQTCTTLIRDTATGRTTSQPCMVVIRNVPQEKDAAASLPSAQLGSRLDRAATSR